jgi:hypothetical protein
VEEGIWREEKPMTVGRFTCSSPMIEEMGPTKEETTKPDAGKESGKGKR